MRQEAIPPRDESEHFRTPEDVDLFYGLGQRVSQLTCNARNMIGNGSTERHDEGPSDFGAARDRAAGWVRRLHLQRTAPLAGETIDRIQLRASGCDWPVRG